MKAVVYEGRTAAAAGMVFGHENMGVVEEVGAGVVSVMPGDRVSLRDLIIAGRAEPGFIVSKEVPLGGAPDAYAHFDMRQEGYSKVVLIPQLVAV